VFLNNIAKRPRLDKFSGCDTPEIGARLAQGNFDAVIVQGWHLKTYLQAIMAAKRLRIPVLAHGDSQLDTPRSLFKRAVKIITFPPLLRVFDAALYVGKRSKAYWRHYLYPESRLFFSPHCVDTDWFAARATAEAGAQLRAHLGVAPSAKVVLFAGKLVPFKRPLDLVAAVVELKAKACDVVMLVAGSGELERPNLNDRWKRRHDPTEYGFTCWASVIRARCRLHTRPQMRWCFRQMETKPGGLSLTKRSPAASRLFFPTPSALPLTSLPTAQRV
jgi:glycosyltransferase involved in cell wall biosynthesis